MQRGGRKRGSSRGCGRGNGRAVCACARGLTERSQNAQDDDPEQGDQQGEKKGAVTEQSRLLGKIDRKPWTADGGSQTAEWTADGRPRRTGFQPVEMGGGWTMNRENHPRLANQRRRQISLPVTTQPCHCEPFSGEAISRLSGQLDRLGIASSQRTLLAMTNTTVLMQH
jgi:hypothetical protein